MQSTRETIGVQLGYAAGPDGNGIVYARLTSRAGERLVRAAFRVKRFSGIEGREVGYAAMTEIATVLRARGIENIAVAVPDPLLADDLVTHRPVPPPLVLPYVRLRCALNQFSRFSLTPGNEETDLAQRARAEVAFHTAA